MSRFNLTPKDKLTAFTYCLTVFIGLAVLLTTGSIMQTAASQSESPGQWSDPSPHEIRNVTVAPGVQLEVLDWGGSGEPLVFLAGLSMNAHAFDDFAPRFTDSHRVIGISRRGHGASSWPENDYSLERLVEDIRIVLDTLGIERTIFAGHSYAGSELTHLAVVDPDRVVGLIYIDAIQDLTQIADVMQAGCPAGREFEEAAVRAFQNPEAFLRTQRRTNADNSSQPNASAAAMERIMANVVPPEYANVKAPALAVSYVPEIIEDIFFGMADPSQACVTAAQRLTYGGIAAFAGSMQRGTVVALQNDQHNLHLVSPNELETIMRRWLADLPEEPVAVTVNSESATVDTTHSVSVEEEARQFMAGYAKDLLSHDPDAIAGRYSQRGTYVMFPGDWNLQPHDSIASMYREKWQGPEAFEWYDLSYEVLGNDAVAVIGGFRFETNENSGILGTYTALLVREDGELRIRLENESFDNLPPEECEVQKVPCDLPLERAAMEQLIGEYKVAGHEDSARVYEEDDSLMIHSPGFPPTRLLYRDDEFRMAEFPGIRLLFNVTGEPATSYIVLSGMVLGTGKRVTASHNLDLSWAALRDSIVSVTQNLANAWIRLDPEEYLSYFSDDLIFYFQGARFTRDDFETIVRESMDALRESTFEIHNPEVKMLDPDAAVITFRLHETMIDKSENITIINGMLSLFYERRNGQWQVVRAHESLSGNGEPQE